MRTKLTTVLLISGLMLLIAAPVLANDEQPELLPEEIFKELGFPVEPSIPGRIEGAGTYFEIKDSEYLNITLKSSEEIKVVLESIPRMISLDVEAATDGINSTELTLKGLEPGKTYYKYEDSYKNEAVFISDENGIYVWEQDLTQAHHIWFQEEKGTTFIDKDTVLDHDILGSVEITANNITLDCNGHKIIGSGTGYGIYLNNKSGVTIQNCIVTKFSTGIYLYYSSNNILTNITANSNSNRGIFLSLSSSNTLTSITANSNNYGVSFYYSSNNNQLTNITANANYYGIYLSYSSNNNIYLNNFINNTKNAYSYSSTNLWNSSEKINYTYNTNKFTNYLGNYWSNYTGIDVNNDGIGDSSYNFTGGQDNYPLMVFFENYFEVPPVPTYNVAVILAETKDVSHESSSVTEQPCKLIPKKTYQNGYNSEYYQDLLYCVADYHKENSFGKVNLNFTIYDNNGGWFKTSKNEEDYYLMSKIEEGRGEQEFVKDAIDLTKNKGIDLSNQDMVIVLHSGTSLQKEKNKLTTETWTLDDQPFGFSPYKIIVAENDVVGGWSHEIGHILGALTTPENTIIPDLYKMGNVEKWDLMARGSWNGGLSNINGTNPPYMSSYIKEFLQWLNYDIHPKSAYLENNGEYWINSLETSNYGDKIFRYNLSDDTQDESQKYYILEARNRNLKTWDSSLPGLPVVGDKNLVLYYVDTKDLPEYGYVKESTDEYEKGMMWNQYRTVTIPGSDSINDGILNPLINETYRDLDNLVKFSAITDRTINDKYEIQARIEEITNDSFLDRFWGIVLRPSSLFKQKVKSGVIFNSLNNSYYSANFQGVATGSPCPSRMGYMAGIIVDIIPASQDIPSMKKDIEIIGPTGTYEGFLKSLDTPNSKHTAEDYRILQIKGFKSDSYEYVLVKKATVNRWFLKNGDKIFTVFSTGSNCELYGVDFFTFNLFKAFIILLFILGFSSLFIYYSRKIGFKKVIKKVLKILLLIALAIIVIFFIFLLLIYFKIISPQSRIISTQVFANNSISASFNPLLEPTTLPDLDLHLYCDDGKHIGMNYETGEYENQISGTIVSGDNQDAPEWIFVPENITNCHYVVSSYDNQRFLKENPEIAQEIGDTTDSYEVYARYIDPVTAIYTSALISQKIKPGVELEHPISGTSDIAIEPGILIVNIDIKPDSYPNSINFESEGVIPVAVLTDSFFDAQDIIINSIVFAGANPLRGNLEDVDNDNDLDLILHFDTQSLQLTSTDTEAVLTSQLNNGSLIKGADSVRIISK